MLGPQWLLLLTHTTCFLCDNLCPFYRSYIYVSLASMQSFPLALSGPTSVPVPRVLLQGDLIDTGQKRTGVREVCFPRMPIESSSNFRKQERDSEQ